MNSTSNNRYRAMMVAGVLGLSLGACGDAAKESTAATAAPALNTGATSTAAPGTVTPGTVTPSIPAAGTVDEGVTPVQGSALLAEISSIPAGQLSDADRAGLLWMREEEKLARDVYAALGEVWGIRAFDNIGAAEETHMDAVKTLLDRYGVADPASAKGPGEFADPTLQKLYDDLVARGKQSLVDALQVGAEIEDLDIVDLQKRASTLADIDLVYDNLERGSRNHLRAFLRQLQRNGGSYTPKHMTQAAFDAIVGGEMERGSHG